MAFIAWIAGLLAMLGCASQVAQILAIKHFGRALLAIPPAIAPEAVTILKPLHGAEPNLAENLSSFGAQQWPAPIQLILGVSAADDTAIPVAALLEVPHDLIVDARTYGANAKISNLINMNQSIWHDLIVLSDSDIAVPPDYLARIAAALARPGVGVVTCVYAGKSTSGFWSNMAAAMQSYQFLPSVLLSLRLGVGGACMGSTIALRRSTLDAIGGFDSFANILADDHAIGAAVRGLGLAVAVAPVLVTHDATETSLRGLVRHELRWASTIRQINLGSHIGATILYPLPFALINALISRDLMSGALVAAALVLRLLVANSIDKLSDLPAAPAWMLPLRDLLGFAIHVASFFVRTVEWRDMRFEILTSGRMKAAKP